mgnify:CR=1 FL=1
MPLSCGGGQNCGGAALKLEAAGGGQNNCCGGAAAELFLPRFYGSKDGLQVVEHFDGFELFEPRGDHDRWRQNFAWLRGAQRHREAAVHLQRAVEAHPDMREARELLQRVLHERAGENA